MPRAAKVVAPEAAPMLPERVRFSTFLATVIGVRAPASLAADVEHSVHNPGTRGADPEQLIE
jgi:hypothetical protein